MSNRVKTSEVSGGEGGRQPALIPARELRFRPSAAESWMHCYGYSRATHGLPRDDTDYTLEGTCAHEVNEDCLRFGFDPYHLLGSVYQAEDYEFIVDEEVCDYMQPGIDRVREFGGRMYVEHKVKLDRWMPGQGGTLDTGVILKDLIVIRDLKWGAGVPVSPVKNKQMLTYGGGFWDNIGRKLTKSKRFLFIIDQPRCNGGGGEWECHLDDVLDHMEKAKVAYLEGMKPDAERRASIKACHWCAKKLAKNGGCAVYEDFMEDIISAEMEDYDDKGDPVFKPVNEISIKRRLRLYRHSAMIRQYLELVHADLLERAMNHGDVPGYKAVAGRKGRKKWVDEKKAKRFLTAHLDADNIYKVELISPAVAEKKLPRKVRGGLRELYAQGAGKPVLVHEDDRREALSPLIDGFSNYEE